MSYSVGDGLVVSRLAAGVVGYICVKHQGRMRRLEIIHQERRALASQPRLVPCHARNCDGLAGVYDRHRHGAIRHLSAHQPGSDAFLIVPLFDMLAFGVYFALAVLWRKKPELHRRLIFVATCVLLYAAFGRSGSLFDRNPFFAYLDG